jgi:hypothetical protein
MRIREACRHVIETYRPVPRLTGSVTRTVDDLRDEIRQAVGRHERVESTAFTKEALAAICETLHHEIDTDPLPAKSAMRGAILREIGATGVEADVDAEADGVERPFRKAELESITAALRNEP